MNNNIISTKVQPSILTLPWLVVEDGELVNDVRSGKRDSSGKFLKLHVALEQPAKVQSAANVAMAAKFNVDSDELFAGSR